MPSGKFSPSLHHSTICWLSASYVECLWSEHSEESQKIRSQWPYFKHFKLKLETHHWINTSCGDTKTCRRKGRPKGNLIGVMWSRETQRGCMGEGVGRDGPQRMGGIRRHVRLCSPPCLLPRPQTGSLPFRWTKCKFPGPVIEHLALCSNISFRSSLSYITYH